MGDGRDQDRAPTVGVAGGVAIGVPMLGLLKDGNGYKPVGFYYPKPMPMTII